VSFDADLYRVLHRGVSGDVAFYRSVCEGAGRALELGCGDGRVTLPLARWGVEITGIDNHPGMLAAANAERAREPEAIQARLRYIEGDICDFDLGARFDRIIAPYTTLYALRPKDRAACLRCVGRHLAPGGRFVFDAYPADSMPEDGSYTDLKPVWITRVIRDQQVIDVYERDRHDAVSQQVSVTYRYRIEDADGVRVVEYSIEHFYLLAAELPALLDTAGLRLIALEGDFLGAPFDAEAERLVVFAEAAS
jgi:SAM-dependent methyltransferase